MQNLGFETLTSVLVPGLIVFLALCLGIDAANPDLKLTELAEKLAGVEWQVSLLALVASSFLGALLASLLGFFEGYVIEPFNAWRLRCHDPKAEWDRYIDSLDQHQNSYIARVVFYFFFELREDAATIILGVVLFCRPRHCSWPATGLSNRSMVPFGIELRRFERPGQRAGS